MSSAVQVVVFETGSSKSNLEAIQEGVMSNFEGTWESTWLGANPNPDLTREQRTGMGIDSLLRLGQRGNHIYYSGKGNQGGIGADGVPTLIPGWTIYGRTDLMERVLVGRFWGAMWNTFTNDGGPLGVADRDSFLNQSGQFFFELSADNKTFTGGYNISSQPAGWFAWDGRKLSHDPRYRKTLRPRLFPRDVLSSIVVPPAGLI